VTTNLRDDHSDAALWSLVILLTVLTFFTAIVVGTDSLSLVPHPEFLDGIIHDGDHDELHF
jgi:hypothetical protein